MNFSLGSTSTPNKTPAFGMYKWLNHLAIAGLSVFTLSCSLAGFDDLETVPCIVGLDRTVLSFESGNALCAEIDSPAAEGLFWVCREERGDDVYCILSSPDEDNDGVGANTGPAAGLDCDDTDPRIFGGEEETACDGKDNDCDGRVDESLFTPVTAAPVRTIGMNDLVVFSSSPLLQAYASDDRNGRLAVEVEGMRTSLSHKNNSTQPNGYAIDAIDRRDGIVLRRPDANFMGEPVGYFLHRTDAVIGDDTTATPALMDEDIVSPRLSAGLEDYVLVWYGETPSTTCGSATRVDVLALGGELDDGATAGTPMMVGESTMSTAPSLIELTGDAFLLATAVDDEVHLTHITSSGGVLTVGATSTLGFASTVAAVAIALGPVSETGDRELGILVLEGCPGGVAGGTVQLIFRGALLNLETGVVMTTGEPSMNINDQPGAPNDIALVWSRLPRGFVAGWTASRTARVQLLGLDGIRSGETVTVNPDTGGVMSLTRDDEGGIRAWMRGDNAIVELTLVCSGME